MKLSIIVTVCNVENFIEKNLERILERTGTEDFEVILVDGSSDNSSRICRKFQQRRKEITWIKTSSYDFNESKNLGMKYATGEYLYFIDAQHELCDGFLESAMRFLDENKEYQIFVRNYMNRVDNSSSVPMFSRFETLQLGPFVSMCLFRRSYVNIAFKEYICSEIIFTGVMTRLCKYFFDRENHESFIFNESYSESNIINYTKMFNLDWIRNAREFINERSEKIDLSYHVIDRCNKNCIACGHFAPLAERDEEGVSVEEFEKDIKSVAFLKSHVSTFIVTGGEPTLNKNLMQIIETARKYFDNVRLCSNGINVKFFEENAKRLNELNIEVYITEYNKEHVNKICPLLGRAGHYNITSLQNDEGVREKFYIKHLSFHKVNEQKTYNCGRMCAQLRDRKIYICQYSANLHLFLKYFKGKADIPFDETGTYIDVEKEKDPEMVLYFLKNAWPDLCYHCKQPHRDNGIDIENTYLVPSKKEIGEWVAE